MPCPAPFHSLSTTPHCRNSVFPPSFASESSVGWLCVRERVSGMIRSKSKPTKNAEEKIQKHPNAANMNGNFLLFKNKQKKRLLNLELWKLAPYANTYAVKKVCQVSERGSVGRYIRFNTYPEGSNENLYFCLKLARATLLKVSLFYGFDAWIQKKLEPHPSLFKKQWLA